MGKKKDEKKFSSFDGHATGYDYLRDKFNKNYEPHRADDESSEIYHRERDNAFQRYLMTGDKYSGMDPGMRRYRERWDKKLDKKPTIEERLFEEGIPVSQWQHYANKAGITNVNSKADAKKLIEVYNQDERYQGPDKPLENETDGIDAPEPPPEPQFNISEQEDFDRNKKRDDRIAKYETDRANKGFLGDTGKDFMEKYKFNVKKGLKNANVDTRGPEAPSFIL